MKNPECDFCLGVIGVCVDCEGCFGEHCQCDPCQHDKARVDECVFCGRGFTPLIDVLLQADADRLQDSLDWLMQAHPSPDQEKP